MRQGYRYLAAILTVAPLATAQAENPGKAVAPTVAASSIFKITTVATMRNPWAMTVLPDQTFLVTDKSGALRTVTATGRVSKPFPGVPAVRFAAQGGLLDVVAHPKFATNRLIYLSYSEAGTGDTSSLAVGRGRLVNNSLKDFKVIWREPEKIASDGQFSGRIAFAPDGTFFMTAGERQQGSPAQSLTTSLGKVLHMGAGGTAVAGNPFANSNPTTSRIWSYGHRNPLGITFDAAGNLWTHENGPQGGDEINLIEKGANYGWPIVSNGTNYGDGPGVDTIPDHDTRPEFNAPEVWWNPSVAPSGFMYYSGSVFPQFRGNLFIGALAGQALIRATISGKTASETVRYAMGTRIREVEQGADGAIWVLEDGENGRLLRLSPLGS